MKKYIRLFTFLSIYHIFIFYIGWNIWIWLYISFDFRNLLLLIILILFLAYTYLIARFTHLISLKVIGAYWIGFLQYALLLFPIANILVFILGFTNIEHNTLISLVGTLVAITLIFIFLFGLYQAYSTVVRKFSITIAKPMENRKNLRIAMASDMHFGLLSGLNHVRRLVRNMNEIKPDLILLPGDVIDDHPKIFIQKKMGEIMKEMSAPLGVYGVLGNHEYYGKAIPAYIEEMDRINIRILQDSFIIIEDQIIIIGRKDKTDQNRASIETLMKSVDKTKLIIMMDHQPFELNQAFDNGVDILLSGHTHRGQMAPNHLITKKIYELDWGYKQKRQLHTFVSSGFGFWGPPLRIGSRSEIVQIDVVFQ